jgi:DNA-binding PadR family transcriptional regulator
MLAVLRSLEKEMGLSELTRLERNILAVLSLEEFAQGARTENLFNHTILDSPTQSSFYRALKRLRENKFVDTVGDRKTGVYQLAE